MPTTDLRSPASRVVGQFLGAPAMQRSTSNAGWGRERWFARPATANQCESHHQDLARCPTPRTRRPHLTTTVTDGDCVPTTRPQPCLTKQPFLCTDQVKPPQWLGRDRLHLLSPVWPRPFMLSLRVAGVASFGDFWGRRGFRHLGQLESRGLWSDQHAIYVTRYGDCQGARAQRVRPRPTDCLARTWYCDIPDVRQVRLTLFASNLLDIPHARVS